MWQWGYTFKHAERWLLSQQLRCANVSSTILRSSGLHFLASLHTLHVGDGSMVDVCPSVSVHFAQKNGILQYT